MSPTELRIQRKATSAFIAADPLAVVLRPVTMLRQPGGGRKPTEQAPRVAQTMRLIPQSDGFTSVQGQDGNEITASFVLMASWDASMALWDRFTVNGMELQVVTKPGPAHTASRYELKAQVAVL